jgi:2-C-methyl-D-erythritol 4-phosphate cytidylyltransferase
MLSAIIVAAGSSRRMGFDKLFAEMAGRPVIAQTIAAFENTKAVTAIIIVTREDRHGDIEKLVREQKFKKIHAVVRGGEHRHDSVRAGLDHLPEEARYVAVHDAARPLVTPEQIERVYEVAREKGAAALAAAVSDTVKRADVDLAVSGSVDRHQLFAMQTPQIFERKVLEDAYRKVFAEKILVTDEVSAVESNGGKVVLVPNEQPNFKITYAGDLQLAEFVLNERAKSR